MPAFKKNTFILFATLVLSTNIDAKSKFMEINDFSKLEQIVKDLNSTKKTLLVMDNDDTLTMMSCPDQNDAATCQYLGGPAWFSWQDNLMKTESHYKVTSDFDQLINISDLLFAMNDMGFTQASIPKTLQTLTDSGVKLLVLTARGAGTVSATENQLEYLKSTNSESKNFLTFISDNALIGKKSKSPSIASPFKPKDCLANTRTINYQQGVMYVAGQNKGEMLKCLLKKTKSSRIRNIIFIDDTLGNVEDVEKAFANDTNCNVIAIHYTALKEHKIALTQGGNAAKYQFNAHKRWEAIKATLKYELQKPVVD